jgi:hypothetical protein
MLSDIALAYLNRMRDIGKAEERMERLLVDKRKRCSGKILTIHVKSLLCERSDPDNIHRIPAVNQVLEEWRRILKLPLVCGEATSDVRRGVRPRNCLALSARAKLPIRFGMTRI